MFTGKSSILSVLRWWFTRAAYQAATRRRWDHLRTELTRRRNSRLHSWNAPTIANPQVGRAGMLTPAQAWRANGGRWTHEQPYAFVRQLTLSKAV